MLKLLMLKGLPASGKSTYAKELVAKSEKWKRVNKDELREMVDGGQFSKANEKEVLSIRNDLVSSWLAKGYCVVVDDTNLAPSHENTLRDLARNFKATFETMSFDVPIMVCIERDAKRGDKSVGAKVIQKMHDDFIAPKPVEYVENLKDCYIFDIDGTLAKMAGRSPYDYSKVGTDVPFKAIKDICNMLGKNAEIFAVSGREASCAEETLDWMRNHGIKIDCLMMRKTDDTRDDAIVKREIYEDNIKGRYNVLAVFDDRNRVVDMWRSLGLTCLQVYYGYF